MTTETETTSESIRCLPPPDESNSAYVTGRPLFCAKLSPSFALFTIELQKDSDIDNDDEVINTTTKLAFIDIIVSSSRKESEKQKNRPTGAQLLNIVEEVERCIFHNLPVTVHVYKPYEKCSCREDCQHIVMYCWNVNGLHMPQPTLPADLDNSLSINIICQEVKSNRNSSNNISNSTTHPNPPTPDMNMKTIKRRPEVRNRGRSARFAELVIDIFNIERLKQSSSLGILDIAGGGTGGLTFELSLRWGIPSTVVDPRPVKLNKTQRNTINFRIKSREILQSGLGVSHRADVLYQKFAEWKPSQLQSLFNDDFVKSKDGNMLLQNCVAVVGMHPDEATDDIIKYAMRYNKPWVICPCCVFPKTFTQRKLASGRAVKSYEDLCNYIKNICDGVNEITLDFEGRNKVYYWLPDDWA